MRKSYDIARRIEEEVSRHNTRRLRIINDQTMTPRSKTVQLNIALMEYLDSMMVLFPDLKKILMEDAEYRHIAEIEVESDH